MEIKIPKEIREYRESIFFGLTTRQFICSLLALGGGCGVASDYRALAMLALRGQQPHERASSAGWRA